MELYLTNKGRINFSTMAKLGKSCESRFCQNFKKSFDWLSFNKSFLEPTKGHRIAITIDPCFISKSGKKTPGMDWFWSGCAAAMKRGLRYLVYPSWMPTTRMPCSSKRSRPSPRRDVGANLVPPGE